MDTVPGPVLQTRLDRLQIGVVCPPRTFTGTSTHCATLAVPQLELKQAAA